MFFLKLLRILFERLFRDKPHPHPWGLRYLLGNLLKDREIHLKIKSFF